MHGTDVEFLHFGDGIPVESILVSGERFALRLSLSNT